ncbi:acyl transferase [Salinimicrobium tongyeongense]|uniref:Acyl transferase n=1 Tax=Salinimicrobium tongyeongense TaxID=2809707 RepID=A0ABY6NTW4_9FLAO|nr:acyl transferase [Salinimicrobium tongyeongense]UZH56359.1 acyl transferase [Salinimicrobium tongyeongense]
MKDVFSISTLGEFNKKALQVFEYQYKNNAVYQQFANLVHRSPAEVKYVEEIPFLPISLFKSHKIISSEASAEMVFTSSGTTGTQSSKHYVTDVKVYEESFRRGFTHFYSNVEDYAVLALLPSYLERKGSSLIYMVQDLIEKSNNPASGFYLHNLDALVQKLKELEEKGQKTLLIGVSFALLDLVENYTLNLKHTIVMETGGMKGRRKEMIRTELHEVLKKGLGVPAIHSEYGMTELLSQAYALKNGIFECPPWMKIFIREPEDAMSLLPEGKSGGINVADLANINSCSFIATQDLGKNLGGGKTEILGRFDHSDIRGCNLMVF